MAVVLIAHLTWLHTRIHVVCHVSDVGWQRGHALTLQEALLQASVHKMLVKAVRKPLITCLAPLAVMTKPSGSIVQMLYGPIWLLTW